MTTTTYEDRPECQTLGCTNLSHMIRDWKDGWASYRRWCGSCHGKKTAEKHGMTPRAFTNRYHPYRRYRKDHCENIDGRLGFVCTTNVIWDGMLDVDHKNGDPSDNSESNLQTLCKCCHAYKTNKEQDYLTPGRLALGIKY